MILARVIRDLIRSRGAVAADRRPGGPITVRDVIYGWGKQIEESGVDFYAHKTGFTPASLRAVLDRAGFAEVFVQENEAGFEVRAVAFRTRSTDLQRGWLGIR